MNVFLLPVDSAPASKPIRVVPQPVVKAVPALCPTSVEPSALVIASPA